MKKLIICAMTALLCCAALSAGDVATFVDKGFSEDGKYYVFGQYGRTDKKYQGEKNITVLRDKEDAEAADRLHFAIVIILNQFRGAGNAFFAVVVKLKRFFYTVVGFYFFYIFKHGLLRSARNDESSANSSKLHLSGCQFCTIRRGPSLFQDKGL